MAKAKRNVMSFDLSKVEPRALVKSVKWEDLPSCFTHVYPKAGVVYVKTKNAYVGLTSGWAFGGDRVHTISLGDRTGMLGPLYAVAYLHQVERERIDLKPDDLHRISHELLSAVIMAGSEEQSPENVEAALREAEILPAWATLTTGKFGGFPEWGPRVHGAWETILGDNNLDMVFNGLEYARSAVRNRNVEVVEGAWGLEADLIALQEGWSRALRANVEAKGFAPQLRPRVYSAK